MTLRAIALRHLQVELQSRRGAAFPWGPAILTSKERVYQWTNSSSDLETFDRFHHHLTLHALRRRMMVNVWEIIPQWENFTTSH